MQQEMPLDTDFDAVIQTYETVSNQVRNFAPVKTKSWWQFWK
jgi:hypothetical protein